MFHLHGVQTAFEGNITSYAMVTGKGVGGRGLEGVQLVSYTKLIPDLHLVANIRLRRLLPPCRHTTSKRGV